MALSRHMQSATWYSCRSGTGTWEWGLTQDPLRVGICPKARPSQAAPAALTGTAFWTTSRSTTRLNITCFNLITTHIYTIVVCMDVPFSRLVPSPYYFFAPMASGDRTHSPLQGPRISDPFLPNRKEVSNKIGLRDVVKDLTSSKEKKAVTTQVDDSERFL